MIINLGKRKPYKVKNLHDIDKEMILSFLQGAVYCWCKNCGDKEFTLRDLFGGENKKWDDTVLQRLYDKNIYDKKEHKKAKDKTGIDAGKLLKIMLERDTRKFEQIDGYVNTYKWKKED